MIAERNVTLTLSKREAIELWRFISFATPSKFKGKTTVPLDWTMLGELERELNRTIFDNTNLTDE